MPRPEVRRRVRPPAPPARAPGSTPPGLSGGGRRSSRTRRRSARRERAPTARSRAAAAPPRPPSRPLLSRTAISSPANGSESSPIRSSRHSQARRSSCFFGMLVLRSRRLRSSALTSAASSSSALRPHAGLGQRVLRVRRDPAWRRRGPRRSRGAGRRTAPRSPPGPGRPAASSVAEPLGLVHPGVARASSHSVSWRSISASRFPPWPASSTRGSSRVPQVAQAGFELGALGMQPRPFGRDLGELPSISPALRSAK